MPDRKREGVRQERKEAGDGGTIHRGQGSQGVDSMAEVAAGMFRKGQGKARGVRALRAADRLLGQTFEH